jgi:hypothetical protein
MIADGKLEAIFVGYENQENLGLRYIMAYLDTHGIRCALAPFTPGAPGSVIDAIRNSHPDLVGFSIIFQYTLHEFGQLMGDASRPGDQFSLHCRGTLPEPSPPTHPR